jgi:hypothetical protein
VAQLPAGTKKGRRGCRCGDDGAIIGKATISTGERDVYVGAIPLHWASCSFARCHAAATRRTVMTDYPAIFEPNEKLAVSFRLPMVFLTFRPWEGPSLQHDFGNKPLVELDGTGMFAELAIQRMAEAAGWEARWVCTYGSKAEGPRYLLRPEKLKSKIASEEDICAGAVLATWTECWHDDSDPPFRKRLEPSCCVPR